MYALGNAWRIGKLALAGVGLVAGGGLVIYGSISALPVYAVGGGLYFLTSLLLVFDSSKVMQDIKRAVKSLEDDLETFKTENERLAKAREAFQKQNALFVQSNDTLSRRVVKLRELECDLGERNQVLLTRIKEMQTQLHELHELKTRYEQNAQTLENQVRTLGTENAALRETAALLTQQRRELEEANARMQELVRQAEDDLRELTGVKAEYEQANRRYAELLAQARTQVEERDEQIRQQAIQVEKLRELHENSKQLIRNLVDAGDLFSDFAASLGGDLTRLNTATTDINQAVVDMNTTMQRLNAQLSEAHFREADADNDGVVTAAEWNAYMTGK